MKSSEIRKRFFDFFKKHNHTVVPSSSLIPAQDPTLLFANAGMNQFKDVFLGLEKRSYNKAVSIQKCVRAGGKHNDLDNVGFTKRHLTFFEMMGNFSFNDYFKKEAISYAWDFLTKEMNLPVETLHVSVYETDDESYDIWHTIIGLPPKKIHRLGEEENFWSMGSIGPCGPCTEIHIDRGPTFGCKKECDPACECDRFLEIWNLVFMQFDRQEDGTLKPLVQTGVDTGMGLERLCSVLQNKDSVFETDLFASTITAIEKKTNISYEKTSKEKRAAYNVLADHIRSASLLIADGCAPSNDGRGYVLRKIIRRAALFAQKLSSDLKLFPELSYTVCAEMGDYYPELITNKKLIHTLLTSEIKKFATNLERGTHILNEYFSQQTSDALVTGKQAFKMYDTYGFPLELIHIMAQEKGYTVDEDSFNEYMKQQKEKSGKKTADPLDHVDFDAAITTEFTGYKELETSSTISALVSNTNNVQTVPKNTDCWVIAKKSPFFIVGGGQVPDAGTLTLHGHTVPIKTVRYINGRIAAHINTPIAISVGDSVISQVDKTWRTNAMKNHTATHMLQSALIELFGKHIKQSGSLVHPDYLRFDFTYHENLNPEDIVRVENLVNQKIQENIPVSITESTLKKAIENGAIAFFGDKYNPEKVRVVTIPNFSAELCGGTHVPTTGIIGLFKIVEVSSLSAGHRRIVAVTGPKALELFQQTFDTIKTLGIAFKVKRKDVLSTVLKQKELVKEHITTIKQLRKELIQSNITQWEQKIETLGTIPSLILTLDGYTAEEIKEALTLLTQKHTGFFFVMSTLDGRSLFQAHLSQEYQNNLNLKDFAHWLKDEHGLRGGSSKTSLRGGGGDFDANIAIEIQKWVNNNSMN